MRRRADIAAGLVASPPVLFLDEPTTGLDPRGRLDTWALVERLVGQGTTLLLTTQQLEEADRLAGRIALLDRGRVVAEGTPDELKRQVGGEVLEVTLAAAAAGPAAERAAGALAAGPGRLDGAVLSLPVAAAPGTVVRAVRALDAAGVEVVDIALRRPTLDDVFLALTGRPAAA
jgi:ABC-2 type transport system ATP-binding protein